MFRSCRGIGQRGCGTTPAGRRPPLRSASLWPGSMTPRSRPPHSFSLGRGPCARELPTRCLRFSRAPSPRTRFFWVWNFSMEKLDILFAALKCPARSPLPKPSIATRYTTRNQHRNGNGKPDLEAIDKLSMHFNTRRETNFAQHRSQDRARGRRDRRGRVGGQERGRSVGESRCAEAARSALRCPPPQTPQPLLLQAHLSFFETPLQSLQPRSASGVSEEDT